MHDGECELKKRLNFCKQYNIFTAFWDFIPKCRSWRIVDAVKDKKREKKKDQNKNKSKKIKNNNKIKIKYCHQVGFEPRSLGWKARIISTRLYYHMAIKQICKVFVQISVHRMGDQELKHITISSQLNFFKSAKRSRKS